MADVIAAASVFHAEMGGDGRPEPLSAILKAGGSVPDLTPRPMLTRLFTGV